MSEYPKVYGHCDAGCKRQVVSFEEFRASATFIVENTDSEGTFVLEQGKTYKISNSNDTVSWGFNIRVAPMMKKGSYTSTPITWYLTLPAYDKYDNYIKFRWLELILEPVSGTDYNIKLLCEMNGVRQTVTYGSTTVSLSGYDISTLNTLVRVYNATNCWVFNEDAEIVGGGNGDGTGEGAPGKDGKTAYQYAKDGGYTGTETEFSAKLATPVVTPQMFGAKGDGITDDTQAFKDALSASDNVFVPMGTYLITDTLDVSYKKSLYSDDGQNATILYGGSNSVLLINRLSVFRNINVTIKNAFSGIVFDVNNRGNITNANGGSSRVEHSKVKFEVKSPNATLIGITADSGTDPNNIPTQTGICFQTFKDIHLESSSKGYGYGIKMELIQGRAFTEEAKNGFPWITHIDYDDIYLGQPQTAIKAVVTNTSGAEHFNRINMGHILFNNVYTQFRDGDTEKFLDVEYFGGYFTKCIGWDYHHYLNAGNKVNIIGEDVTACFLGCSMNFGKDFLQTCDFTAETEYTVADNPEYFIHKYFNGTVLTEGYDTIDAKIDAKLNGEYIGNIAEEKINDVLYSGYANVMNDPLTQIKDGYRFSNSSQIWESSKDMIAIVIPAVKGGNIIRWSPSEYRLSDGFQSVFFFNDDQLTEGIFIKAHADLWDSDGGYLQIDNPSGYKYISIPFQKLSIVDSYDTPITLDTLADMVITINREITGNAGKSYTEHLRDDVINPAIAEEVGKLNIPTKVSQLNNDNGYLTKESDPTVPAWAKESTKPTYTASEVGADESGTASSAVSTHNVNTSAHNDIRVLIEGLTTRLNALANSDDTTLDQMAEVVAYIKNNKSLIDGITTSKVSVSDIIDNLTTSVSNKPLSAKQGVALKALIDAIVVPTKASDIGAVANTETLTMVGVDADGKSHTWTVYGKVVS